MRLGDQQASAATLGRCQKCSTEFWQQEYMVLACLFVQKGITLLSSCIGDKQGSLPCSLVYESSLIVCPYS